MAVFGDQPVDGFGQPGERGSGRSPAGNGKASLHKKTMGFAAGGGACLSNS